MDLLNLFHGVFFVICALYYTCKGAIYEIVSIGKPSCSGIKQKSRLSNIECILACQTNRLIGIMEDGECVCLQSYCLSESPQHPEVTMFKQLVGPPADESIGCKPDESYISGLYNGKGSCESNAAKSCKYIKEMNPKLNVSQFYWIQLDRPTRVYCDMVTDGGGWLMIGNITSTSNEEGNKRTFPFLSQHSNVDSLDGLSQVDEGRFVLSGTKFANLSQYVNFKQIRIFCTKPSHRRIFHVMSLDNDSGDLVKKFVSEEIDSWLDLADCSTTFSRLDNDNSSLALQCMNNNIKSSDYEAVGGRLYGHFMFKLNIGYLLLKRDHMSCDDQPTFTGYDLRGIWHYFVR